MAAPASLVAGAWGVLRCIGSAVVVGVLGGAGAAGALTFTELLGGGSVFVEAPAGSEYRMMLLSPDPKDHSGRASVSATADASYRVSFEWLYSGEPGDFGDSGIGSFGYRHGGDGCRADRSCRDVRPGGQRQFPRPQGLELRMVPRLSADRRRAFRSRPGVGAHRAGPGAGVADSDRDCGGRVSGPLQALASGDRVPSTATP